MGILVLAIPIAIYWFYRIIAQQIYKNADTPLLNLSLKIIEEKATKPDEANIRNVYISKYDYMRTLQVGDAKKPKNLVFCHGYLSGLAVFHETYKLLNHTEYNIYAFDWLGLGLSSRSQFPDFRSSNAVKHAEDYFVDSLELWRQEMNLEKMTVCAHSLGGYLISAYAIRYPQRIERLILVSPAGYATGPSDKPLNPVSGVGKVLRQMYGMNITPPRIIRVLGPIGLLLIHVMAKSRFLRLKHPLEFNLLKSYLYATCILPGTAEAAVPSLLHTETAGFIAKNPMPQRMKDLDVPILFIFGSNDWMDHNHAVKCQAALKKAQVVVISDTTHHLYMDEPELFSKLLQCALSGSKLEHESIEYI